MFHSCVLTSLLFILALKFVESRFKIVSPKDLTLQFSLTGDYDIPYQVSRYGQIPYGSNLVGTLILPEDIEGCSLSNRNASHGEQIAQVPIFIVRRGKCKFLTKSRYAQLAGAKMLVIVDFKEDYIDHPFGGSSAANDLQIPTILIPNTDGEKIINFLQKFGESPHIKESTAVVSMSFPVAPLNTKVSFEFWFSSADPTGQVYTFFKDFRSYYTNIAQSAIIFQPHYISWQCASCESQGFKNPQPDCISGGRYCAPDPDQEGPLTGANVIYENLRQICLWNTNYDLWWAYVGKFGDVCKSQPDQEKCVNQVFSDIGVNSETLAKIDSCMHQFVKKEEALDQKINEEIDDNVILAKERSKQEEYDISLSPSLFINQNLYYGQINAESVFKTLCDSLSSPPESCIKFSQTPQDSLDIKTILIVIGIMTLMVIVILYFYRRMQRRDMSKEMSLRVSQMVSQYLELTDSKN